MKIISAVLLMLSFLPALYFHSGSIFADLSVLALGAPKFEVLTFSAAEGIPSLIKIIIGWAFKLAGVFAFAMIVFAGFEYTTSGGNTSKQKDAQERIISAIVGIILLFAFYIILYTINPDILKSPSETAAPTPPAVTPPAVTPPDQTPSNNLVNIKNYQPAPILSGELQGYDGVFLDQSLANDLSDITKNETYAPFVVTDACITDALPCLTTENTRPLGACHYYGTCVDIDSPTGDNKTLITIFNQNGLAVLEEGDHLHISLLEATGYGSYQDSGYSGCTTEKKCCFTLEGEKACWYSPT